MHVAFVEFISILTDSLESMQSIHASFRQNSENAGKMTSIYQSNAQVLQLKGYNDKYENKY